MEFVDDFAKIHSRNHPQTTRFFFAKNISDVWMISTQFCSVTTVD
jgi:hypothetical protein